MVIRKIWTGTVAAVAVVAMTSWASMATAALPEDVSAALSPDKTPAQQAAAVQALATANAGSQANYAQLVQLVAAGISQQQAASFAGALAAACGASGNNAQTTQALVNGMVNAFPEAGGAIVGQAIAGGCSAEVAANTLQQALLTAAGQSLRRRLVLKNPGPGTGVDVGSEAFVKSENTTRLGNRSGTPFIPIQEGAQSPTRIKDQPPEVPEYVPPEGTEQQAE
jgi:hypothetical protein